MVLSLPSEPLVMSTSEGSVRPLPRVEAARLQAAEGWLTLGLPSEACRELWKIRPGFLYHPQVLGAWWQVYAAARWWEAAWIISKAFCQAAPHRPESWICQANALRYCKGLKAARTLLLSMVERFPEEPVLSYNLACYTCQLGRLGESGKWLLRAFEIENSAELKVMALMDHDLEPLWNKIGRPFLGSFAWPVVRQELN